MPPKRRRGRSSRQANPDSEDETSSGEQLRNNPITVSRRKLSSKIVSLNFTSSQFKTFSVNTPAAQNIAQMYLKQYESLNNESMAESFDLLSLIDDDDERDSLQTQVQEARLDLVHSFETFVRPVLMQNTQALANDTVLQHSTIQELKLHTLLLNSVPVFSGDVTIFSEFRSAFENAVHLREIPPTQKLGALRSKLSGRPLKLVENFGATELDYEQAYKVLLEHYSGAYRIASELNNRYKNIRSLKNRSLEELEPFLVEVTNIVSAIDNLRIPNLLEFTRFCDVFERLPAEMKDDFFDKHIKDSDELPSYKTLVQYLNDQVRMLQARPQNSFAQARSLPLKHPKAVYQKPQISTTTIHRQNFAAVSNTHPPDQTKQCFYCNGNHFIYHCDDFLAQPVSFRHEFVNENYLCPNCLSSKHQLSECKSTRSCMYCKKMHHSHLHQDKTTSHMSVREKSEEKPPPRNLKSAYRSPSPSFRSNAKWNGPKPHIPLD